MPVLAVASLGFTIYNDWRHLYFIAAPFGLLVIGSVRALVAAAAQGAGRAYGLAIGGAGATLAAMVALHPYQSLYFNAFVDRATPEFLRTQYDMSGVDTDRDLLEFLLARYPYAPRILTLTRPPRWAARVLPAADRARFRSSVPHRADFL